jgi:hypothetical protein
MMAPAVGGRPPLARHLYTFRMGFLIGISCRPLGLLKHFPTATTLPRCHQGKGIRGKLRYRGSIRFLLYAHAQGPGIYPILL